MTPSHYKNEKSVAQNTQCFHPDLGTAVAPFAGPAPSGCRGSATSQTFLRIPPDIGGNRSSRRHPLSSLQKPTQDDRLRSGARSASASRSAQSDSTPWSTHPPLVSLLLHEWLPARRRSQTLRHTGMRYLMHPSPSFPHHPMRGRYSRQVFGPRPQYP